MDLVSIIVNQVTSPCKNIVSIQILINFFPLFSSQRNKKCLIVEGETTPTKSVPLPMEEVEVEEEETEEAREEEEGEHHSSGQDGV